MQNTNTADQKENCHGQKGRCALDGFELHAAELNKKPEQLKAALVKVPVRHDIL